VRGAVSQLPDQVVVKLTPLAKIAPSEREAVIAEAVLLQKVKHEAVVACLDVWVEDGSQTPYRGYLAIAMSFCDSGDLARLLANNRAAHAVMPARDVLSLGAQIAEGLACVHAHKILHRDVKPGNIFLSGGGRRAVLGDFGVSRQLDFTAECARTYAGTPQYMPPEVISGRPYDAAADVWALGVVLYEMIVGDRPFRAADAHKAQLAIMKDDPVPKLEAHASEHPGKYERELVTLVSRCLVKEAASRPTAAEVATALKGLGGVVPRAPGQPGSPVTPAPAAGRSVSPLGLQPKGSPLAAARRAPVSPLRRVATPSPSDADSPAVAQLSGTRAGRLRRLRDAVTSHTREGIGGATGQKLQAALGSGRLTALAEVTVALYAADGQSRVSQALSSLFAGHRTVQSTSECVAIAVAHYFTVEAAAP
jgi:NIMA (never in mitosis gene a)-related kinase